MPATRRMGLGSQSRAGRPDTSRSSVDRSRRQRPPGHRRPARVLVLGRPAWSNDGTRLAINRIRDTADGTDPVKPIGIVDVASGDMMETGPSLGTDGGWVEWAPDDTAVLLVHIDPHGGGPALLDPAGGPPRPLPWDAATYPNFQRLAP